MESYRFAFLREGEERRFFGVSQTSESLVFHFNTGATALIGRRARIEELHFTVHALRAHEDTSCIGNRVTINIKLEGQKYARSHLVIKKIKRHPFIWRIATVVTSAQNASLLNTRKRKNVHLIRTLALTTASTMCYTLYIAEKGVLLPQVQGSSLVRIELADYDLGVYLTTLNRPDAFMEAAGVDSRFPPLTESPPTAIAINPLSLNGIERNIQLCTVDLVRDREVALAGKLTSPITEQDFHRWPACTDAASYEYGEASRLKNDPYFSRVDMSGGVKPSAALGVAAAIERSGFEVILRSFRSAELRRLRTCATVQRRRLIDSILLSRRSDDPDHSIRQEGGGMAIRPFRPD